MNKLDRNVLFLRNIGWPHSSCSQIFENLNQIIFLIYNFSTPRKFFYKMFWNCFVIIPIIFGIFHQVYKLKKCLKFKFILLTAQQQSKLDKFEEICNFLKISRIWITKFKIHLSFEYKIKYLIDICLVFSY